MYASVADLRVYASVPDSISDSHLEMFLKAATITIEQVTNRFFNALERPVETLTYEIGIGCQVFPGHPRIKVLVADELYSVTSVATVNWENQETVLPNDGYTLIAESEKSPPYRGFLVDYGHFNTFLQARYLRVNAVRGYTAVVPAAIRVVCLQLAAIDLGAQVTLPGINFASVPQGIARQEIIHRLTQFKRKQYG